MALLACGSAWADTVTLRSDGKAANDPADWSWTGTELGDVDDGTYATVDRANRWLRSSIANNAAYAGCTINSVEVNVRAAQTTGDENLDFGLYDAGTGADYVTGTPVTPPTTFLTYTDLLTTRPWGGAWTDTDVNNLVVAVRSINAGGFAGEERLSEAFVIVDFNCVSNTPPTATINNPADASSIGGGTTYLIDGTANDTDGTVASVEVRIRRDTQYWNGSGWTTTETWLPATGTTSWSYSWNWIADDMEDTAIEVMARATDDFPETGPADTNNTTVDTTAPRIATGVRFSPDPTSGDASFWLASDWTEANPGTPQFRYNLNNTTLTGWADGSGGNTSTINYLVGLTGSDYFTAIESQHADSPYGNGPTLSQDPGPIYVLPLTPDLPTVLNNGTTDSLDVTIVPNASEGGTGMLYAIQCHDSVGTSLGFVQQATGLCDVSEDWRDNWATPVVVGGLGAGTTYQFSVAAGNPKDGSPTTGERSASAYGTMQSATTSAGNTAPTVTITSPTDLANFDEGTLVNFSGTASDVEDGDLTANLAWTSSINGSIGSGGSFSRSDLSVGTHTITASVTDSGALPGQDQISITINAVVNDVTPDAPTAIIDNCNQITVSVTFTGDANNNSTTLFQRSPNGVDSWTPVTSCGAGDGVVSGPSPRTCIDTTVADNSTNFYRVEFSDIDGVNPPGPSAAIGPYDTTPFCTADSTTVGTAEAEASTCNQVTVLARFTGDGNLNGSTLVEYRLSGPNPWSTGCATLSGVSPRQCVIPELDPSTAYDIQITFTDPDGVAPDNNLDANSELISPTPSTVSTTACGTDTAAATILFLAPTRDAILGGTDSVKVQVFDEDLASLVVQYSLDSDGDTGLTPISQNTNYVCGTNCAVYEFNLDTSALAQGSHYLTVKATDTEGNIARVSQGFRVNNDTGEAAGDGLLLRRTHGSQLCIDCHNLPTHSSQSTSNKYGNWAVDCMACHTPHMTANIYLIRPQIRTPNSGLRDVRFETRTGAVATSTTPGTASFANEDNAAQADGPCQACHTRTKSDGGDARWQNAAADGNVDTHYTSSATSQCTGCHTHDAGFSGAGGACDSCHFAPPTVGAHSSHDEVGTTPTDYANLTPTTTPTQYGFACAKCHSGTHFSDSNKPHTVEVSFDATQDPQNPGAAYSPGTAQTPDPGVNGDGWNWSEGDCSNLYCHSNAAPRGGLNTPGTETSPRRST